MHKYPYRDSGLPVNSLAFDSTISRNTVHPQKKRMGRVRVAWFIIGMAAGILSTLGINAIFNSTPNKIVASSSKPMRLPTRELPAQTEKTPEVAAQERPSEMELTISRGDTFSDLLIEAGVSEGETHAILNAMRKKYNPRRLSVGQKVFLKLTPEEVAASENGYDVAMLRMKINATNTLELVQNAKADFDISMEARALNREVAVLGGTIKGSLYQTGIDSGLSPALINNLMNAYSYDVDFQRDIHPGDSFQILYENFKNEDGETAGKGRMLSATLVVDGEQKKIYGFNDAYGNYGYYDAQGNSVRKGLLMTPINGARLSSGFGMRRHPILGYSKMHKGVDFAAPTGTPVYAAGDGVIEFSGRKGGYGNYVRVAHNSNYSTAYAHLNKINSKARKGSRVRQGDIIGFVGTTGNSTGPHLHYEVLAKGTQVNPKNIKFQTGNRLEGRELASFKTNIQQLDMLASRTNEKNAAEQKLAAR